MDLAGRHAGVGVAAHLGHEEPAVVVKGDGHGIDHVGLAGHKLDAETLGDVERGSLILWRERSNRRRVCSGFCSSALGKEKQSSAQR